MIAGKLKMTHMTWLAFLAHTVFLPDSSAFAHHLYQELVQPRLQALLPFASPLGVWSPGSLGFLPQLTWTCMDVDCDSFESRIQFGENGYLNNSEPSICEHGMSFQLFRSHLI